MLWLKGKKVDGNDGEGKLGKGTLPLFGLVEVKERERKLKDFHSLQISKKWTRNKKFKFKFLRKSFPH